MAVHSMHGIGNSILVLKQLKRKAFTAIILKLLTRTDKLFLPANNLDQLQKYIGNEGDVPRIHKMGGRDWSKVVTKAKKSIDDLADKLVEIYAQRGNHEGLHFYQINHGKEFEDAFPYGQTEDQFASYGRN